MPMHQGPTRRSAVLHTSGQTQSEFSSPATSTPAPTPRHNERHPRANVQPRGHLGAYLGWKAIITTACPMTLNLLLIR